MSTEATETADSNFAVDVAETGVVSVEEIETDDGSVGGGARRRRFLRCAATLRVPPELQGASWVPLLKDDAAVGKQWVFSQYPHFSQPHKR